MASCKNDFLCTLVKLFALLVKRLYYNAKTQALPIGPCKYNFDLTLNGSGVTKLPSIRILGVELDSMLNFMEHISSQLKKTYVKTGALRRIRHFVPMDVSTTSRTL